jgi:hypothetical protein
LTDLSTLTWFGRTLLNTLLADIFPGYAGGTAIVTFEHSLLETLKRLYAMTQAAEYLAFQKFP